MRRVWVSWELEAKGEEDVEAHKDGKASARGVVGVVVEYPRPFGRKIGGRGEPCLLLEEGGCLCVVVLLHGEGKEALI